MKEEVVLMEKDEKILVVASWEESLPHFSKNCIPIKDIQDRLPDPTLIEPSETTNSVAILKEQKLSTLKRLLKPFGINIFECPLDFT